MLIDVGMWVALYWRNYNNLWSLGPEFRVLGSRVSGLGVWGSEVWGLGFMVSAVRV